MSRISLQPAPSAAFAVQYVSPAERAAVRAPILAEIRYGDAPGAFPAASKEAAAHPLVNMAMRQLSPSPVIELWTSPLPVKTGVSGHLSFAHNDAVLFGAYRLPFTDAFEADTAAIYRELVRDIAACGYPHLLRIWNHFPAITQAVGELDRYKVFCRARAEALQSLSLAQLPAASAVGSEGDALVIYFLAGKTAGLAQENPRQMSAYRYPPQYGPRSPAFARATWVAPSHLFISGTASILGHASVHPGDTGAQAQETLCNVAALLAACGDTVGAPLALADLTLAKVYLRTASDYSIVHARLAAALPAGVPVLYLKADICRTDLLLEIEGIAAPRAAPRRAP